MKPLLIALLSLTTLPAAACLNDRQTILAENEFKSSYLKGKEESRPILTVGGWLAIGIGGALLITTPLLLRGTRPRK